MWNNVHLACSTYFRFFRNDLTIVTCAAEEVSKECGSDAKELMLQALKMSKMQYTRCQKYLPETGVFMQKLGLSLEPECSLSDFLSRLENSIASKWIEKSWWFQFYNYNTSIKVKIYKLYEKYGNKFMQNVLFHRLNIIRFHWF